MMEMTGYAEVMTSLLEIVYDIIIEDQKSRENLTPDQTIQKVQQISFLCRNTFEQLFDKKLQLKFNKCKTKLGFTDALKIDFPQKFPLGPKISTIHLIYKKGKIMVAETIGKAEKVSEKKLVTNENNEAQPKIIV